MSSTYKQAEPQELWTPEGLAHPGPAALFHLILVGLLIGFFIGALIAIFRLIKGTAYNSLLMWMAPAHRSGLTIFLFAVFVIVAALIVCRLIRNPPIRLGGEAWIAEILQNGAPHPWGKVLFPKFIAILMVLSCGISVGSEGPSIQMGAAGALGLKRFTPFQAFERRFFILAGCAAGLAAAFSAPFAGICYVYEIMKQKMSRPLFTFLLAVGVGVYISCYKVIGLATLLPMPAFQIPDLVQLWVAVPLAAFAGIVGIAYTYLLHTSQRLFSTQKKLPLHWLPIFAFAAAFFVVLFFPQISGEGMNIFGPINAGLASLLFLWVFLGAKLIFTAFCYGTFIPAGVMVPLLCVGGVAGAIYFEILQSCGICDAGFQATSIVMGMAAAFAAAEHAPITAAVLVAEMTGSWNLAAGLLAVGAMGFFLAKLCRSKPI